MYLLDFATLLLSHYPDWKQDYQPYIIKKNRNTPGALRIKCNAVIKNSDGSVDVIGVYKQDKTHTYIWIKQPNGIYVYGNGSESFLIINKRTFEEAIVQDLTQPK